MDDDSCGKFIGSLTKYLQSLCHSYVDFDKGVELVGHIYLNVDTGKKIDYVLNESVCKNGANVVKFTSNSYHAQPVEKKEKKETPKKDGKSESGKKGDDDDVIIVGSEGSRRNRTPGSSPSHSHASPNQMQRGMGLNRMGMFRSPRGPNPRLGSPLARGGYTYQPRQRLTYPQPRNYLNVGAGYSPRMRQQYQPRAAQPMPMRGTNPSGVDRDITFMREEYVAQPGQTPANAANQPGYQQQYQQQQQQQQSPQMQPAPGQLYGAPYTQGSAAPAQPTNVSGLVTSAASMGAAVAPSGAPGQGTTPSTDGNVAGSAASSTDPSLFQQSPAMSGGMPLPVTTHTIFDSGPVMSSGDLPSSQGGEGVPTGVSDPLAPGMTVPGTGDGAGPGSGSVPTSSGSMESQQNLLIGQVWSESSPGPATDTSAAQNAPVQAVSGDNLTHTASNTAPGEPTAPATSMPSADSVGTLETPGFDVLNQQSASQISGMTSQATSGPFSPTLNQNTSSTGPDGDGFSALVSELQALNQQPGSQPGVPSDQPTSSLSSDTIGHSSASTRNGIGFSSSASAQDPTSTAATSSEDTGDGASTRPQTLPSQIRVKRDPGLKHDPDISANFATSVLHESTEAAASQGSETFLAPMGVGGSGQEDQQKRSGSSSSLSRGTPSPSSGNLVGPESVVIETKPFLHHASDYDSGCDSASTSTAERLSSPQGSSSSHPHPRLNPSTQKSAVTGINIKQERQTEEEAEMDAVKTAQSEWVNKENESEWVTDMSALNNSDDSMDSDSESAQDDDDPNYTPGRPLGTLDKGRVGKRSTRKSRSSQQQKSSETTADAQPSSEGKTDAQQPGDSGGTDAQQHKSTGKPEQQEHKSGKLTEAEQDKLAGMIADAQRHIKKERMMEVPDQDVVVHILDSDEEDSAPPPPPPPPQVTIKQEVNRDDEFQHAEEGGQSVIGVHKRKPWSEEEKMAVDFHFRGFFEDQKLPGKQDIEAVIELEPVLRGRTWQNIKDYCRNVHFVSAKRARPKQSDKGSKGKKRKLDTGESEDGGEEQPGVTGDVTTEDESDPPLPDLPPALDSDQQMEEERGDREYKAGTFLLVNINKDSDRPSRSMRPSHTPAEVIVTPDGQPDGIWVHTLVPAGSGMWRLPSVDQLVDLRIDPADIVKTLEKAHVNIVGSKVLYKFDDM